VCHSNVLFCYRTTRTVTPSCSGSRPGCLTILRAAQDNRSKAKGMWLFLCLWCCCTDLIFMWPGSFLWWPVWPSLLTFLASKGLFKSNFFVPPGSPSMSQGGLSSKCPGAGFLKTVGAPSCAANMLMSGISRGACFSSRSPSARLSCGGGGGASSPRLRMPSFGASHGGVPSTPEPSCGGNSGSVSSPCRAAPSALGSNASGSAVVAFSAMPMSLMLAVPSVGVGVVSVSASNDAPPGSCTSMTTRLRVTVLAFPAPWTGPRPTPPASSGGSSHKWGGIKASRWRSVACHTGAAPSPGAMPHAQALCNGEKG
jgi:hypothetical protein